MHPVCVIGAEHANGMHPVCVDACSANGMHPVCGFGRLCAGFLAGTFFFRNNTSLESWDVFWSCRTHIRTTLCRLPGRGLFFSETTRPWNFGMCFGDSGPISGRRRAGFLAGAFFVQTRCIPFVVGAEHANGMHRVCARRSRKRDASRL